MNPTMILGYQIGTNEEWDLIEPNVVAFYGFKPDKKLSLPEGDLTVDYENGKFEYHSLDGVVTLSFPIVPTLAKAFL